MAANTIDLELLQQQLPSNVTSINTPVSRWSNTKVGLPAAIIKPTTEDEILKVLRIASQNHLKVIPVDGAHATFVPITNATIYLDLSNLDSIDLDPTAGEVKLGGGVITRDLLHNLTEQGFYTCIPNSNAVGIVGFCLGGGSSPFNGWKGLAIDNILSIRLITANGKTLTLTPGDPQSEEEKALFNVLCGAGFGFGIITSLTLRAWPLSSLQLLPSPDDNITTTSSSNQTNTHIWTRRLLFPPTAIHHAASLFTSLQQTPSPLLTTTLLFMRAPPSAPHPGTPLIMHISSYFGLSTPAEKACAATFSSPITSHTISATTTTTPFAHMNDTADPLNRHGDYKEMYAAWLSSVSTDSIERAFERWVEFGESTPEAKNTSFFVLAAKSTEGTLAHDGEGRKFFPRALRGRRVFAQVVPWWTSEEVEGQARGWGAEMLGLLGAGGQDAGAGDGGPDGGKGLSAWAANLTQGVDLETVWTAEQRREIRRVKGVWDPSDVFWNPVVDGV